MEAQNKQKMLSVWHWLMLTVSVASAQMTENGAALICNSVSLKSTLDCSERKLTTLPSALAISNTLTFNISGNALQHFPGGTVRFTSPRLETLDLSHNQIEQFDPMAFGFVPSLKYLNVSHNKLSSIMSGAFVNVSNLQALDISLNNLVHLPEGLWEGLMELKELLLSSNHLSTLKAGAFDCLRQLEYLDLSHNQISSIDMNAFTDLVLLKHLKLYRNVLKEVPHIPLNFRQDLQTLNLSGNPISTLGSKAFGRLVYLHYLDLSKMDLTSVDPTTFKDLQALHELYLNTNKLQTLQVESIDSLQSLHSLSLFENQWACDCSLSTLVEYLFSNTSSNISVTQIDSTTCRSSDSLRVPLRQLENSKFCTASYKVVLIAVIGSIVLVIMIATSIVCVCRKKRLTMQDEQGITRQTSPVSVQSSVAMTYNSSGDNSSLSGDTTDVFTTSDHFYSKVDSLVYSYADSRDLLPQRPVANTSKFPRERCFSCPSKSGEGEDEAKDDGLYLKAVRKPLTN